MMRLARKSLRLPLVLDNKTRYSVFYVSVRSFSGIAEDHVWFEDWWMVASWCDK
jgi:hypothetical protein